jgi:hypothetical protein
MMVLDGDAMLELDAVAEQVHNLETVQVQVDLFAF